LRSKKNKLSSIKKLAGQTLWYGVSSIAARFINYLLTPYLTYSAIVSTADYGKMSAVYAAIPIFNIVFTYGMETAYFRFAQRKENVEGVNNTATISLLVSTVFLSVLLWFNQGMLASIMSLEDFPVLVQLSIVIIALDALSTIPFARLRYEERPRMYAFIKVAGILINVFFTIFFLSYCPAKVKDDPNSFFTIIYDADINPITYVLWANIIQSIFTLVLLSGRLFPKKWAFNTGLWKEMLLYSLPMLVAGMGGMVNETFSRLMLGWWLPGSSENAQEQTGIFNACYKLSILITLFVQAFRMSAEPFFFKQAEKENPQRIYARVMKFFVIAVCLMFLAVSLFIPVWKYFIGPRYWQGLSVVPILLLANMFLGIYYNLSVWYKLTGKTMAGAWVTLIGTAITFLINFIFIPFYGYVACAWATFICYGSMMALSFLWGQKAYYVPYAWKKLLAYIVIVVLLFFVHKGIIYFYDNDIFSLTVGSVFTLAFIYFVLKVEKKEFIAIPVVGKYVAKYI
jgi:O-antigen/teichoic acid export membrane protein